MWLGALHLAQLYIVRFLAAALAVFFNVARTAYLPAIVPREHLVEANRAASAGMGTLLSLLGLVRSPVRVLRDVPDAP